MEINKIAVIGAGNMGHQIAICAALSGFQVRCMDSNPDILIKAIAFADNYLIQSEIRMECRRATRA
jgi:3-hydroxybutyryl-CoA dehydrogenase